MTALQLGHPAVFPFVDPPSGRAIKDGYQLLAELGALEGVEAKGQEDVGCPDVVASPAAGPGDEQKIFPARLPMARQAKNSPTSRISNKLRLSPQGRLMARLPLDPRIARMILAARDHNALREACIIAAALSVQDPRQRPAGREKEADKAHQSFAVRQSDFLFYLKLWDTLHAVLAQTGSQGKIRKFCAGHFLSYQRLREWQDVHEQILRILADERGFTFNTKAAEDAAIHQALLSGNLRNIALKKEKNIYQSGGGREVTIFPGSTLYHRNFPTLQPQRGTEAVKGRGKTVPSGSPQWIMAAELVETDRLYARTVAAIAPEWLEPLARPLMLMRYSHHDPHWEKGRGQVVAWEKGTLFGLVVVAGRKVAYARIDQEEARRIFLQSALVAGELRGSYPFLEHNRECVARLQNLEERSRRRDLLVDEHTIFDFYDQRLGPEVYDQASLNHLLKTRRGDDFLQMSEQDLSVREPEADLGEKFPTALEIGEISLKLTYCFKPGAEDDGLSVLIPAHLAADLRPELFEWLVPGMLPEKILFLLKNLPKNLRRHLVPIPQTAAAVTAALTCPGQPGNTALYQALSRAIYEMFGLRIDRDAWPLADLPPHLRCRFCLLDEEGKVLTAGRNLSALVRRKPTEAGILPTAAVAALRKQWELKGIAPAELPKIPARLPLLGTDGLLCGYLFPGLEESDDQVNLRLFTSEVAARAATRNGLLRLYRQTFASRLKVLRKDLLFPRQHWRLAQGFGTLEQLSQAISTFILRQIFDVGEGRLISAAQFIATTEQVDWPGLYIEARRLFALVLAVLSQRFEVLNALTRLQQLNQAPTLSPALSPTLSPAVLDKANPRMNPAKAQGRRPGPADKNSALVAELCGQLKALVPPDFLDHCTASSLARLPVYIKALEIRSQRAQVAPAKDATKAAQLKPYQDRLQKNYPTAAALFGELPGRLSEQKKARLTEYRLMLEEYKISLFAQELKTLFPVSPQRLDEKWREVEEEAFQGYSILVHKEGDFL
ncbi:MAG: DUF3418 domain-containing protein [Desulfobulbaceae bacterium]|nr:MAG: DUF3418 domain-containing protein [Desulfobulbaceae bacterium]